MEVNIKKVCIIIFTVIIYFCIVLLISRFVFRDVVTNIYAQAVIVGILCAAIIFLMKKTISKITK